MEMTISTRQWAIIKRTAQNVQPLVQQKQKLQAKIAEMIEHYKSLDTQIQGFEQGIKALCQGLGTEQLVCRTVTPLDGRFDKDGKQLKKTSYEPSSIVTFNADQNNYTIRIPENTETENEEKKEVVGVNTSDGFPETPVEVPAGNVAEEETAI